jgi:hypothetical protein
METFYVKYAEFKLCLEAGKTKKWKQLPKGLETQEHG